MTDTVAQVVALETDVALSAASAEVAADAASRAIVAAEVLEGQVEHAEQAAAAAIVDEVHANTEQAEWNTERLNRMEATLTETRAMVGPLMATLETLTAAVSNLSSVASPLPAPVTPSPAKSDGADPLEAATPVVVAPEAVEPKPESPARKEKRFRLMR